MGVGGDRLPRVRIPDGAVRSRVTGSQVYGFLKCEHSVWLDFLGDKSRKLPPSEALEHLLARGRAHEDVIVDGLDYVEPDYEPGDFVAGARATRELLERGVDGVSQGVLRDTAPGVGEYLGIPDLLRRTLGESALGEWHYVVGDIKSSWRPRSDQALQVAFYSWLLGELQGIVPDRGYLILRDGSEEEVDVRALTPVLFEVLEELDERLNGAAPSRPHRTRSCADCGWREVCAESRDVHWIPGLTRSVRGLLEATGYASLDALRHVEPRVLGREGVLAEATWQRARWGAIALTEGRAHSVRAPRLHELRKPAAAVVVLRDGFDQRCPVFAWQIQGAESRVLMARTRDEEQTAIHTLLAELRGNGSLCHSGGLASVLYEFAARSPAIAADLAALEARAVDLMSIARGAWVFPSPVRIPHEVLAWVDGEDPGAQDDVVALALAADDFDTLEQTARTELEGVGRLLERLTA